MANTTEQLPDYLASYCFEQDYSKYTPRQQASWRYIMKRALPWFRRHAVPLFEEGLGRVGIDVESIPRISVIDSNLQKFGWGAVPVVGFIPPWAFMEFQARRVLPIATDMRTVEHISYTPAPDIVHEATGHAPLLIDEDYRNFLSRYAAICTKAIYSDQDIRLFEAVRQLSDLKENPMATEQQIARAGKQLEDAEAAITYTSEASLVARMNWWTTEYGLVGSVENPLIYGAGLLSSIGESQNIFSSDVKKIPLSLDCIHMPYNITRPQPQLYVARNLAHLNELLEEIESTLASHKGGISGLAKACKARAMTTTVVDGGTSVSGRLVDFICEGERIDFLRFEGPVQLARDGKQLEGHDVVRHPAGFSSPLGAWQGFPDRNPAFLRQDQLESIDLIVGETTELELVSGFHVVGELVRVQRRGDQIEYLTWKNCTVRRGDKVYFEPDWGEFDMLVGVDISSVYGGPADRAAFGEHEKASITTVPGRRSQYSAEDARLFEIYQEVRDQRSGGHPCDPDRLQKFCREILDRMPGEWLVLLEILELVNEDGRAQDASWVREVRTHLEERKDWSEEVHTLIRSGIDSFIKAGA